MPAWTEIAHSLAACSRVALESGIALILRSALPISAALAAGWLLRRHDPKSRAGIYTWGLSAAMAVLLLALLPFKVGRSVVTISLPEPLDANRQSQAVSTVERQLPVEHVLLPNRATPSIESDSAGLPVPAKPIAVPTPTNTPAISRGAPVSPNRLYAMAAAVWAIGATAWLIWLAVGQIRLNVLFGRARRCGDTSVQAELESLTRSLHLPCPILLITSEAVGPFVTGIWRPKIVLPEALLRTLDRETTRAVFAHELQHIAARDILWTWLSRVLCAILWPQPLLWALARRWRDTSEEACDRAAIQQGCSPAAYARCLVTIAESFSSRSAQTAAGLGIAGSKSALGHRVEKIMNHRTRNASAVSPLAARITIVAFGVALLIASRIVTAQDSSRQSDRKPPERATSAIPARSADKSPNVRDDSELSKDERDLYLKEIADAQRALDDSIARQAGKSKSPDAAMLDAEELRAKMAARVLSEAALEKAREEAEQTRILSEKQAKTGSEAERQAAEKAYERALKMQLDQADKRATESEYERALRSRLKNAYKRSIEQAYEQLHKLRLDSHDARAADNEYLLALKRKLSSADQRAADKAPESILKQDRSQADRRAAEKELDRAPISKDSAQANKRAAEKALDEARRSGDAAQSDKRAAEKALDSARQSQDAGQADKRAAEKEYDRTRTSGDAVPDKERAAIDREIESQLKQANRDLADTQARLNAHTNELKSALAAREAEELQARQSKQLDALEKMLVERQSQLDDISLKYRESHPRVRATKEQIEALQMQIADLKRSRNESFLQAERAKMQSSDSGRKMQAELGANKGRLASLQAKLQEQLNRERVERSQVTAENRVLRTELERLRRELEALQRQKETAPKNSKQQ